MKKLISILGVLVFTGAGASVVTACNTNLSQNEIERMNNQRKVNDIKNKITITDLELPNNTSSASTVDSDTTFLIRNRLLMANEKNGLRLEDVNHITFDAVNLEREKKVPVKATIALGEGQRKASSAIMLSITVPKSDYQDEVDGIKNNIKITDITVNEVKNPDTTNEDTRIAILAALVAANIKTLSLEDAQNTITFEKTILVTGKTNSVKTNINKGSGFRKGTASLTLNITLNKIG